MEVWEGEVSAVGSWSTSDLQVLVTASAISFHHNTPKYQRQKLLPYNLSLFRRCLAVKWLSPCKQVRVWVTCHFQQRAACRLLAQRLLLFPGAAGILKTHRQWNGRRKPPETASQWQTYTHIRYCCLFNGDPH